jgi:hypothetical protein
MKPMGLLTILKKELLTISDILKIPRFIPNQQNSPSQNTGKHNENTRKSTQRTNTSNDELRNQADVQERMNEVLLFNKIQSLYCKLENESIQPGTLNWGLFHRHRWVAKEKEITNWLKLRGCATHLGICPDCKIESVVLNADSTVGQCLNPDCIFIIAPEIIK